MQLLRYIGDKVSKQAYRMNIGSSVRHHYELDVDSATFCFGVDFGDKEAIHLSRLLKGNTTLQTMRLRIQPALTVRGAEALAKAIVKSSIKKLLLFGTVRTAPPDGVVMEPQHHHPREQLEPNRFAEGHPSWEFANPDAVQALLLGISKSDTIQELIISHDTSHPPGALSKNNIQDVALALQNSHSIKSLNLCFNLMGDDDVELLLQHWRRDSPLQEMHLKLNRISSKGALQLVRAAASTSTPSSLQKLDLSFNFDIGYDGLARIAQELLPRVHLRELKLRCCIRHWEIANDGDNRNGGGGAARVPSPAVAARQKAEQALVEAMRLNVYLQTLDVRNNHFSDEAMAEISFYCNLNKSGRHLLAMEDLNSGFPPALWANVLAKCRDMSHVYYFLRQQPHLAMQPSKANITTLGAPRRKSLSSSSSGFTMVAARSILKSINNNTPLLHRKRFYKWI